MAIAVSPSDPSHVYLLASSYENQGNFHAVFKSVDVGASFVKVQTNNIPYLGYQEWYDWTFSVDPNNSLHMYAAGVYLYETFDGGMTWSYALCDPSYCIHVDFHYSGFHPITGEFYVGNDGGIFKTPTSSLNWTSLNDGLAITQYYRISTSETSSNFSLGGSQDNGTHRFNAGANEFIFGGDGMDNAIDYTDDQHFYVSTQRGNLHRTSDGGYTYNQMINPSITSEYGAWVTPFKIDPNNPARLIAGFESVWESTDYGVNWSKLGIDNIDNAMTYLDIAKSNSQYLYATNYWHLIRSTDGGQNWNIILDSYSIRWIEVDDMDENHLWVCQSDKVLESFDGGVQWTDITNNLPDVPMNTLVYDENGDGKLFVGTDLGVFYRTRSNKEWLPFDIGLPNVRISELDINENAGQIYAGTYGRGLWKSNLPPTNTAPCEITNVSMGEPLICASGANSYYIDITYEQVPLSGRINVNGNWYDIEGADQQILFSNLIEGSTINYNIYFEDDPNCSLTGTLVVPSTCECQHPDYVALEDLYNSTNGNSWNDNSGWLTSCDPCNGWYGVYCNDDGRVSEISLGNNNLNGQIPNTFGTMVHLEYVHLWGNNFPGPIPNTISSLINLRYLHLSNNSLTGNIPSFLGQLTKLRSLVFHGNNLTGSIPTAIMSLPDLFELHLSNNQLTGSIPTDIGMLSELRYLFLNDNQLTGSIPTELGSNIMLRYLSLSNNNLSGNIPTTLSQLTELSSFYARNCNLSGQIPDIFGGMSQLERVDLAYNNFSGSIPPSLGTSNFLIDIYLNDNNLSGCLPNALSKICHINTNLSNNPLLVHSGNMSMICSDPTSLCDDACTDGFVNFNESSIDCGGPDCNSCTCTTRISFDRSTNNTYSFENEHNDWFQYTDDGSQWRYGEYRHYYQTGPTYAFDQNTFLYIAPNHRNNFAILESECLDLADFAEPYMQIAYHMYGVDVKTLSIEFSTNNGNSWQPLWSLSGDQNDVWHVINLTLSQNMDKLRIIGETGTDFHSVIAIDALSIIDNCKEIDYVNGVVATAPSDVIEFAADIALTSYQSLTGTGKIDYHSPTIYLLPSFEVSQGTTFETFNDGCNAISNPLQKNETSQFKNVSSTQSNFLNHKTIDEEQFKLQFRGHFMKKE